MAIDALWGTTLESLCVIILWFRMVNTDLRCTQLHLAGHAS